MFLFSVLTLGGTRIPVDGYQVLFLRWQSHCAVNVITHIRLAYVELNFRASESIGLHRMLDNVELTLQFTNHFHSGCFVCEVSNLLI
jgi:hypothetical protein